MSIKIRLSKHAQDKLLFYGIDENVIKEVLEKPQQEFYDIARGVTVAIKRVNLRGEEIGLIVILKRENDTYFVVTAYPAEKYQKEAQRKVKSGRWIPRKQRP